MQPEKNTPEAAIIKAGSGKTRTQKPALTQDEIDTKAQELLQIALDKTAGLVDAQKVKIWAQNTDKDANHRNGKVILGVRPNGKFLHYTELATTMNSEKISVKIDAFLDTYTRLTAEAPAAQPAQ